MNVEEIHNEYEEIKSSWRSRGFAERAQQVARLQELALEAQHSPDGGLEMLEFEIRDLIVQIGQPAHRQVGPHYSTTFEEPSDHM